MAGPVCTGPLPCPPLDPASRGLVAPVVFQGRLLALDAEEQKSTASFARATFRVQKLYKGPGIRERRDVVVEFALAGAPGRPCRGVPLLSDLHLHRRYLVFGAPVTGRPRYLLAIGGPYPPARRRALVKVLCPKCAKPPAIHGLSGEVPAVTKQKLSLKCVASGNPSPRILWFKDNLRVKASSRIKIRFKKRYSRLVIRRVNRKDGGYYECRAVSVLGNVSTTAHVIVTSAVSHPTSNDSTLWPLRGLPCPMASYCLNGGTCSLYETVGEYVCVCAEGYRGRRCENKDISTLSIEAPNAPHDLDATTRMLQLYWGK